jgi:hypothetical protein
MTASSPETSSGALRDYVTFSGGGGGRSLWEPFFLSQSDGAEKGFTPVSSLTVIVVAELLVS